MPDDVVFVESLPRTATGQDRISRQIRWSVRRGGVEYFKRRADACQFWFKSFWDGDQILSSLMLFARGNVKDLVAHPKSITDLRSGVEKRRSSREV